MIKENNDEGIPSGYTRVTDVFKPFTKFDLVDEEILASRSRIGNMAHHYAEMYSLKLLIDSMPLVVKPYFLSFKKWFDEYVEKVVACEMRVNSQSLLLSGKIDLIVKLKGDNENTFSLIDEKIGTSFSPTWRLQTAAYRMLFREEIGLNISRRLTLRLQADGSMPLLNEMTNHEYDELNFLKCLDLHRFFNGF